MSSGSGWSRSKLCLSLGIWPVIVTSSAVICVLLLATATAGAAGVNGEYSQYNQYAKHSPSTSSIQSQSFSHSGLSASSPVSDKSNGNKMFNTNSNSNRNNNNLNSNNNRRLNSNNIINDSVGFNSNLDISLVDTEPEANLFLDEASLSASTVAATAVISSSNNNNNNNRKLSSQKNVYQAKSTQQQQQQQQSSNNHGKLEENSGASLSDANSKPSEDKFIDIRHLALIHPASSVIVRASYGPFSARQTINPFAVSQNSTLDNRKNLKSSSQESKSSRKKSNISKSISEQITAYLVTKEVRRSHPVLRVLFYASHLTEFKPHSQTLNGGEEDKTLCAAVIVQYHGERLFGTCSPSKSKQNACLAEVTIPALYWPPLDVSNSGMYAAKQQKSSSAKVYYTIAHTAQSQQCSDQNFLSLLASSTADGDETVSDLSNAETSMNLIFLSEVSLAPFRGSYEEVTNDNVVTMLIPQEPVYPNSKIYIPVKYTYNPDYPVSTFSLRVQVKPGLKILGAQLSHPNKLWQLSVELGPKQTTATVTAFLRDYDPSSQQDSQSLPDELLENMSQEVYSWLIEIDEDIDISEINGRIVWQLLYNTESTGLGKEFDMQQQQSQQQQEDEDFEKESAKLTSLIDIQKDVVQEILAITKSRELLNTAILNGRQVSKTMRIYQVSASGSISDITFQCSCQSVDESILKVSPSCTSVYLDGSEVRGSQNSTIIIKYGSFTGQGNFIVWMPLIPLDVRVSDNKLSQIKGWRVPYHPKRLIPFSDFADNSIPSTNDNRFDFLDEEMLLDESMHENDKFWAASSSGSSSSSNNLFLGSCRLRFQQTRIEIYTRFLSTDHNSGREASLLNRKHSLRITHLVRNLIRVTDTKVLRLRGNIVEGVGIGRADVEVISPLTGAVIGSKEVRVTMDRESITRMEVRPISGISLEVESFESNTHNVWSVKTNLHSKMTKQYQEALLESWLFFSDHTSVPLSEITNHDYKLNIDTFKGVVANVPRASSGFSGIQSGNSLFGSGTPRIIALLPGKGELVQMTLDLPYECQRKKSQSLATKLVDIDVDFQLPDTASSSVLQNDAINYRRFGNSYNRQYANNQTMFKVNEGLLNRIMKPLAGSTLKKRINTKNDQYSIDGNLVNNYIQSRRNYPIHSNGDFNRDQITFQRHSTISPSSSKSNMQFGIYSLLCIVSVASIIIVILYSVFSLRFRNKSSYSATTTTTTTNAGKAMHGFSPFSTCVNNGNKPAASKANEEWIWVGKDELENSSRSTNSNDEEQLPSHARPLLPIRDFNSNITETFIESSCEANNNNRRSNSSNRLSNTNGLNITANPVEMLDDEYLGENQNCDLEQSGFVANIDNILSRHNPSMPVLIPPSHKSTRIMHTSGLALTSPDAPPPPIPSRTRHIPIPAKRGNLSCGSSKIVSHRSSAASNVDEKSEDEISQTSAPPPVPPHRGCSIQPNVNNIASHSKSIANASKLTKNIRDLRGTTNNSSKPPPIPLHRNSSKGQYKPLTIAPSSHYPSSFSSNKPHSSATSVAHPRRPRHLFLGNKNTPETINLFEQEEFERLDHQLMMKVFDRLKESSA